MTPRSQMARKWQCWDVNLGLSQLDLVPFAQPHGVTEDGEPVSPCLRKKSSTPP